MLQMKVARKIKIQTFCAQIWAVMAIFVLILTNVSSTKYFYYEHMKVHDHTIDMESAKHSFSGLHDHKKEDSYTHTHTDVDGTTHTHKHHHDHCPKLASPIIACLYTGHSELMAAISSLLLYNWTIAEPIYITYLRELFRPPILA